MTPFEFFGRGIEGRPCGRHVPLPEAARASACRPSIRTRSAASGRQRSPEKAKNSLRNSLSEGNWQDRPCKDEINGGVELAPRFPAVTSSASLRGLSSCRSSSPSTEPPPPARARWPSCWRATTASRIWIPASSIAWWASPCSTRREIPTTKPMRFRRPVAAILPGTLTNPAKGRQSARLNDPDVEHRGVESRRRDETCAQCVRPAAPARLFACHPPGCAEEVPVLHRPRHRHGRLPRRRGQAVRGC